MINLRAKEQKNIAFQSFISLKKFKALIKKNLFLIVCVKVNNYVSVLKIIW